MSHIIQIKDINHKVTVYGFRTARLINTISIEKTMNPDTAVKALGLAGIKADVKNDNKYTVVTTASCYEIGNGGRNTEPTTKSKLDKMLAENRMHILSALGLGESDVITAKWDLGGTSNEYDELTEEPSVFKEYNPGITCPICGGFRFYGHQQCWHDVHVINGLFDDDIDVSEANDPYGPYTCECCGAEFEDVGKDSEMVPTDGNVLNLGDDEVHELYKATDIAKALGISEGVKFSALYATVNALSIEERAALAKKLPESTMFIHQSEKTPVDITPIITEHATDCLQRALSNRSKTEATWEIIKNDVIAGAKEIGWDESDKASVWQLVIEALAKAAGVN